ncbi:Drug/metabolite transporter [Macleaya cordata]|uniref:Probable purine permease n=1 Tax=Macleaya cordata TaxID=56857 RepID=A0A200Q9N3_MACCD|nr:Drug/metabolite transporter [Macleaya cordata]
MATEIEKLENGTLAIETHDKKLSSEDSQKSLISKYGLLLLNIASSAVGTISGPILLRLYFIHGGSKKWISSWLETAGFPLLIIPITILYMRQGKPGLKFLASPFLVICSILLGIILGLNNFMYAHGLSYLPVSTSSLLLSTQLIFTAFFALIIVRQKFTPYSINAVVLMTLGSILLGLSKSGDRPFGVTNAQYLLGFILTIGSACLAGFILPCTEAMYAKASQVITFSIVLQLQFWMACSATVFSSIGMLINNDFSAIPREAGTYELGAAKYYMVLVSSAVVWQMMFVGTMGIIFCSSSLFAGIINATLLPLTEIVAVIVFHEKFNGEKGMALALGIWGFTSYFYGSYRDSKKQTQTETDGSYKETKKEIDTNLN